MWIFFSSGQCVKIVEQDEIYITVDVFHYIFCYNSMGECLQKYGKERAGTDPGEFWDPRGLTVDDTFLYICDFSNHRIQVLERKNGLYSHHWICSGVEDRITRTPSSITLLDNLLYVGENVGVQIFTKEGICLQEFPHRDMRCSISGLCFVDNQLYTTDELRGSIDVWGLE